MLAPSPPLGTLAPARALAAPAILTAAIAAATLLTVWTLQHAGYAPCELCLKERIPFYWGTPLAVLVAWIAARGRTSLLPAGYAALALTFVAGAALGVYHAGVEWALWPGPSSCTGAYKAPAPVGDFIGDLNRTRVVRCDAAAMHVLGLSLAAWNAVLCVLLATLAVYGFIKADRARA